MSFRNPFFRPDGCLVRAAACAVAVASAAGAAATHPDGPLQRVAASLAEPDSATVDAARRDVQAALEALRLELDQRAIGAVLREELQIDRLAAELRRPTLDADALGSLERPLRRTIAGRVQSAVDRLRAGLARLVRLVRLVPGNITVARQAVAVLAADGHHAEDGAIRSAFQTVAAVSPAARDVASLRRHVSVPNASTFVSGAFLERVSRRTFEQPVGFRDTKDGATIAGDGRVAVSLSAVAPPSADSNRIVVRAVGGGSIVVTADRRRVHVRATASPRVMAAMDLLLLPDRIDGGRPGVHAGFHTTLAGVEVDGALGRCRLVRRLAGRVASEVLAANDPVAARRMEAVIADRVDEEGRSLAHRVNGLLHHGLWDRLAALDYVPDVRAWNDVAGLHAATFYAHDDQLGALRPPPAIPSDGSRRLDVVNRVHESAINNTLAALGGLVLDENAFRGIWEVQLKLTSEEWARLAPGRIPAAITLAGRDPAQVRLDASGVDVVLRATSCAVDGRIEDAGPREVRFRYRVERGAAGLRFVRDGFEYAGTVPDAKVAVWDRVLPLFFGREIAAMRRYRPAGFSQYLRTTHVDVGDGWLTVGGERVEAADGVHAAAVAGEER